MIKLIDLLKEAGEAPKCPVATQNPEVNEKQRQLAIDQKAYGPKNPNNPNIKFWKAKAALWNLEAIESAKGSRCNSCALFNITEPMLTCMGVAPVAPPVQPVAPPVDTNPVVDPTTSESQLKREFMLKLGKGIVKEADIPAAHPKTEVPAEPAPEQKPAVPEVPAKEPNGAEPEADEPVTEDSWDSIEAGKTGYCMLNKFKATGSRTCNSWRRGGPYKGQQ